jgi:hypothetical protein
MQTEPLSPSDIQLLIASRLEDMAAQVERLYAEGNYAEAQLLREEGLQLAEAYDNGHTFLFITDLRHV